MEFIFSVFLCYSNRLLGDLYTVTLSAAFATKSDMLTTPEYKSRVLPFT
jgi:hypothetical protein